MDFEIMRNQSLSNCLHCFCDPSVLPLDGEMQNFTIVENRKI